MIDVVIHSDKILIYYKDIYFKVHLFVTCLSYYFLVSISLLKTKFITVGFYIIYEHMGWWFYTLPWNGKDAVNI